MAAGDEAYASAALLWEEVDRGDRDEAHAKPEILSLSQAHETVAACARAVAGPKVSDTDVTALNLAVEDLVARMVKARAQQMLRACFLGWRQASLMEREARLALGPRADGFGVARPGAGRPRPGTADRSRA